MRKFISRLEGLIVAVLLLAAAPAVSAELKILTSFPDQFYAPFVEAFETSIPAVRVFVLNKNSNLATEEIVAGNRRRFDLFWSSAPDAFVLLKEHQTLISADAIRPDAAGVAPSVKLDDSGGFFQAFALSSVGWSWNIDRLDRPPPRYWDDLLAMHWYGRIAMARPSRSDTTHLFIESILQNRGWDDGWRYLLSLAGNLATVTARSFSVVDGVERGRFDIGLIIDFLAQSQASPGSPIRFRYGLPILLAPARIALLKGGMAPDLSQQFIDMVLSDDGQRLLLAPEINRIPVSAAVRAEMPEEISAPLLASLTLGWSVYDAEVANKRCWVVNALFDALVAVPLVRRRKIWRRLNDIAARASASRGPAAILV